MSRYSEDAYREFAQIVIDSNEISFDEPILVSRGDGPGAWVQGWFWVSDEGVRLMKMAQREQELNHSLGGANGVDHNT